MDLTGLKQILATKPGPITDDDKQQLKAYYSHWRDENLRVKYDSLKYSTSKVDIACRKVIRELLTGR